MRYERVKHLNPGVFSDRENLRGHVARGEEEIQYLEQDQVWRILRVIENDRANPRWRRDWFAIYCGFYFALRIGEVPMLDRETFRLVGRQVAFIRTLKRKDKEKVKRKEQGEKIKSTRMTMPPAIKVSDFEPQVSQAVQKYLDDDMRKDQNFCCEAARAKGSALGIESLRGIFSHYLVKARLNPEYSFHALRHGRAAHIWSLTKDLKRVQQICRHSSMETAHIYTHINAAKQQEYQGLLETSYYEG